MAIGWALVSLGSHAETFLAPASPRQRRHNWSRSVAVTTRGPTRLLLPWGARGLHVAGGARGRPAQTWSGSLRPTSSTRRTPSRRAGGETRVGREAHGGRCGRSPRYGTDVSGTGREAGCRVSLAAPPRASRGARLIGEGVLGTLTLVQAQWGRGPAGGWISPRRFRPRSGQHSAWWGRPEVLGGAWAMMAMVSTASICSVFSSARRGGGGGVHRWAAPDTPWNGCDHMPEIQWGRDRHGLLWVQDARREERCHAVWESWEDGPG